MIAEIVSAALTGTIVIAALAVRGWFHGLDKRVLIIETKMEASAKSGVWKGSSSDHE